MMKRSHQYFPIIPVLIAYAALLGYGLLFPGKWQLVAQLAFYCTLGQAFNLFMGMTGYVDFGYVAFLGVGTYGMAISIYYLSDKGLGLGLLLVGFLTATVFSILLSLAVGAVALRLRGAYFAIATIGVNEGFRYLIEGARIWNGADGIIFTRHLKASLGRKTAMMISTFWADILVLTVAVLAALLTLLYLRSKVGYALLALREDEDAAKVMGINVTRFKIIEADVRLPAGRLPDPLHRGSDHHRSSRRCRDSHGAHRRRPPVRLLEVFPCHHPARFPAAGLRAHHCCHHRSFPRGSGGHTQESTRGNAFRKIHSLRLGMSLLKCENVTKRFGGLVAVDNVSFEIGHGELMAIVGPNGAGKTTMFNLINGVFQADEGEIWFEDVNVTQFPAYKRAHLGMGRTFQIPRPFASATVQENIAIGAMFGAAGREIKVREAMDIADHYIELIGLKDHRDKPAGGLTPIEKKLVEIARALAMKPRLLLMDEAMAGMNPRDIDDMVAFIRKIRDVEGIAVVSMVEHIMRAVAGLAERVLVMHQGAKLVDLPTTEALTDPRVIEVYLGHPSEEVNA
jgi:branched-chain amino acid transport system ATP-binding protein